MDVIIRGHPEDETLMNEPRIDRHYGKSHDERSPIRQLKERGLSSLKINRRFDLRAVSCG